MPNGHRLTNAFCGLELAQERLNGLGIRGIRFNLVQAGATTAEMIEPLSRRVPAGFTPPDLLLHCRLGSGSAAIP
jgi:hypothetical protein